jgi:hypothetical protein
MSEDQEKNAKPSIWLFVAVIFLVFLIWGGTWYGVFIFIPEGHNDWAKRGQFGDLFGSVNALFSGFAFAGIIYTIYLQRKEIALQRLELKLQRQEMAASTKELKNQVKVNIVQLEISKLNARIEAQKALLRTGSPNETHNKAKDEIDKIANDMQRIIDKLDKDLE